MSRAPQRTTASAIQKSPKNGRVIILTENTAPRPAKHATRRVVTFSRSRISAHLPESLRDLYIPQATKMK